MIEKDKFTEAAKLLGSRGGKASAQKLTPEQRKERASKAVQVRLKNKK